MKYFLDNIKTVLVIIAVIMLIMLLRECNGRQKAEKERAELIRLSDSLTNKVAADSAHQSQRLIKYQADSAQARQEVLKADSARYVSESKLNASQSTVLRLVAKVEQYRYENDSSTVMIPVSENYIISCDSLTGVVVVQQQQINEHQKNVDGLVELMNYEVILRDSLIEDGKAALMEARRDYHAQAALTKRAIAAGKPTGSLMLGGGAFGNKYELFQGAGVCAAYLSKNGKLYLIGANLMIDRSDPEEKVRPMFEAKILITLIK